jgi:4'-phosphopantetheinyl transferase
VPLPPDELHVWRATLDRSAEVTAGLERVLSADERSRARRFYLERLRARYVVGRGLLRVLLARYVGGGPEELEFTYGEHGKPLLRGPGPWFNLAHSGAEAVFAFSSSAEVGVDVELADTGRTHERVAERFFAPAEVESLHSLPGALRPRAFLCCWTRKEAFIKARGDGLSLPLTSFEVTLAPDEPPAVLRTAWSTSEPAEWSLVDLSEPGGRVIAAAAGRHPGWRVVRRRADDLAEQLRA